MYYEPDIGYYEPSEAESIFDKAKEELKQLLNNSIKYEIEQLKKENENLKEKNKKLQTQVNEIESRERKLEHEKNNMLKTVRRERLSKLMEDFKIVRYSVTTTSMYGKKCNKCNDDRDITFTSPLGKEMKESCECDKSTSIYVPEEDYIHNFSCRDKDKMSYWYTEKSYDNDDYYTSTTYMGELYKGQSYESIENKYRLFFNTEEECQLYCDWLNKDIDMESLVADKGLSKKPRSK